MKKLLLAVLFLGGMTAQANTVTNLDHTTERGSRYNQPQSITFIERGVQFVVFTNGQFDFATTRQGVQGQGRRGSSHTAPGHTYGVTFPYNNRGFVKYNRYGDVYQVGRSYVNYNRNGDVSQIGSVDLRYRNGRLVRAGDMQIVYNRRGQIVNLIGHVHHDHAVCGVCGVTGCTTNHFDYTKTTFNGRNYRTDGNNWHGINNRNRKHIKNKGRRN